MPTRKDSPKQKRGAQRQTLAFGKRLYRYWSVAAIIIVVLLSTAAWYGIRDVDATVKKTSETAAIPSGLSFAVPAPSAPAPSHDEHQSRMTQLAKQVELADHTLCSYKNSTKYPNDSRPIAEHPDQIYPNQAIQESHAMRKSGGGSDANVQIQTSQSRVYLASGEAVAFTIRAIDSQGKSLPLFVTQAVARGLSFQGSRAAPTIALNFSDDGQNGDVTAGDGIYSNVFTPGQTGFSTFNGTIRTEVSYNVGDKSGVVLFDVIYSPNVPATWTGGVREAVENGSLNFYLKANVLNPGRYVVTGRVDDANGKPFALVSFNDLLVQGPNEVRLSVYGKLMRDDQAVMPLTLRDVDAYLLNENTDPDRALMARLAGNVYTSKNYPLQKFSDDEWQSEERSRYMTEFNKDLEAARNALVSFDPAQAQKEFPLSECSKQLAAKAAHALRQ